MTKNLEALRDLIFRLQVDYGIIVACVGGAARDTYLGREPKDYDLVVLSQTGNLDDLATPLVAATGASGIAELGQHDIENYVNKGDDRGLRNVYELHMPTGEVTDFGLNLPARKEFITIQVIVFNEATTAQYKGNPYLVVEDHDCDLNKAWFEEVGGKLVARVSDEFPSPFWGNENHFKPGYSNHERKRYIAAKFPEFNHK